jgi:hypothetical protein
MESVVQGPPTQQQTTGVTQWSGDLLLLTVTFQATENVGSNPATVPIDLFDVRLISRDPNTVTPPPPPSYAWPDVNNDGKVDGRDVVLTFKDAISGPPYKYNTDFDGDGIVDAMDAAIVCSDFGQYNFLGTSPGWGYTNVMSDITGGLSDGSITVTPDVTPPTTTLALSGTLGNNGWYTSAVAVTLTATDLGSGVAQTCYSFDDSTWYTYSGPFVVTNEGTTTIYYYSTDNAGNVEPTNSYKIGIDESAPVITVSSPTAATVYPTSGPLQLSFTATDDISGVNSVTGMLGVTPVTDNQVIDLSTLTPGTQTLSVTAIDNAGNTAVDAVSFGVGWTTLASSTSVLGGSATVDQTAVTGVSVSVSGSSAPDGTSVTVTSSNYGTTQPTGTGVLQVGQVLFYDVQISSSTSLGSNAMVSVSITSPLFTVQNSVMSYWDASTSSWISVATTFIAPDTVCGIIPASDLTGTPIMVHVPIHDVAVTDVTCSKTVVFKGYTMNINVTAADPGNYTETFNVTAYANATAIATQTVTLTSGNSTTVTFTWNATGFLNGIYTISAYAEPVQSETNTANNNFTDGNVYVSMVGDLTGTKLFVPDGKCDGRDITVVALCFGSSLGQPRYNPNCDLLNRGRIDGRDITIVALNFGKHDP